MTIDQEEIAALFRTNYEGLHRYAFSLLKDRDAAKDVVQAVFLNLLEKQKELQIKHSVKSYLFRSVYNGCLNQLKKDKRITTKLSDLPTEVKVEMPNYFENDKNEITEKINQVLNRLPKRCREVFLKSRLEQKKYHEIAEEMAISVKTVEAHMSKALKLIRTVLRVLILIFVLIQN